jgi:predicted amidohydrolase
MTSVRVACQQIAPVAGDLEGNRRLAREGVRDAVAAGAGLVVLPELCTSGYVLESAEEARSLAQPAHGGALAEWAEAAGDAVVVGGFAELGDDGRTYNSAAVVDRSGVLAVYRKAHLWDREKLLFAPGDAVSPVIDTRAGRIGVLVCYDVSFPEPVRSLAMRGADIVAVPTNNSHFPRPDDDQLAIEIALTRTQAYFNRVYVAFCDRAGSERGVDFLGGSAIAGPEGWSLTPERIGEPALLLADCDLDRARDKDWTERNHAFGDRRPELYEGVGARVH